MLTKSSDKDVSNRMKIFPVCSR